MQANYDFSDSDEEELGGSPDVQKDRSQSYQLQDIEKVCPQSQACPAA